MPGLPGVCAVIRATAAGQGCGAAGYTGEVEPAKNKEILHKGIEAVRFQIRVTTYILENEGKSRAYEYARTKLMAYNQMLQILGMYGEDKHSLMRRIISNAVD